MGSGGEGGRHQDGIAGAVALWRYELLPERVVRALKLLLVDVLAVTGGAARAPGIGALNDRLARWERDGTATSLTGKRRFSPPSAALANGAAAHALDFDDIHDAARVHSGCIVVPTLLATAEDAGPIDGRRFLLALAIGIELHARLGLACDKSLALGWHPTPIFGGMAAAVAAARMLELDPARIADALGIAFHQASGSIQSAYDGVLAKRVGAGFAARDAVTAAFLAKDGITGTHAALEGKAGFYSLHMRGTADPALVTHGLGETWRIAEFGFKPWPGCRCSHGAIGLALELRDGGLAASAVESVEIRMSETNWKLVGAPYDAARDSTVHAQFSAAYSFARALADGRVGPRAYDRPAITEPRIVELARRVTVVIDPAVDAGAMEPVAMEVRLRDGHRMSRNGSALKGSPEAPMSEREMLAKLAGCLDYGLDAPSAAAERLAEVAFSLERETDAAKALVDAFPT